ncbi:MAG: HD domain-containing protein [Candidatus Omnitrophica bacterium]|nr:HD domain-containing protein [Candidatus Omnitrophota bacterium]
MNKRFIFFRSFRAKVTAALILLVCFSAVLSNFLIYEYSLKTQFNQLRDKLMTVARAVAMTIDPRPLADIPMDRSAQASPQYRVIETELLKMRSVMPSLAYMYILKKTETPGILQFVIDIHPGSYAAGAEPAVPGEKYDARPYPELLKAFDAPAADRKMISDKWGVFLSGYSPIRDGDGNVIAVLGIDMAADDVYAAEKETERRAFFVLILGILLSATFGFIIAGRVVSPVKKLVEGTRHISSGDLKYKVPAKGSDEIAELADSFNKMGANLFKAREALLDYFYRAVQSLIRILEARDPSTKGHSDRVAGYAVKIAESMGVSKERIELLREAALLHDIGKLGIHEMILSKKVLSDEDWHAIRKHPAIGAEILKPVCLDPELLSVIKEHHERYDGKGYPDGLSGGKISLLAAIVSVADSYDAMISDRGYQKTMDKAEAIAQLSANSGSQFDPEVVRAFIKVLEKDRKG